MKGKVLSSLIVLGVFLGAGCGRDPGANRDRETASTATGEATDAATAAAMCLEHGILEALCTRCHPNLIPVFQAKGDWCAEHEFPESLCPQCHPERGGKPETLAGEVGAEDAPAHGLKVRFKSPEVAEQAGIETARAESAAEIVAIVATATLVADPARSALVNAPAPGVIRSFKVDLGTRVAPGTPLAVIESAAVAADRGRLAAARARAEVAATDHRRERELHARGISALKQVQAAEQAQREAEAEVLAALSALEMVGAQVDSVGGGEGGPKSEGSAGTYTLRAPVAGVVVARHFTVGTLVDLEETVLEIVDTAVLWADIDIPESQVGRVAQGQSVVIEVDALPGRSFTGTIRYLAPVIDPRTRTVQARAAIDNRDGALRANMYARARIAVPVTESSVVVPRSSVQAARGVSLAFVALGPSEFETRRVRVLPSDSEVVQVTAGLRPGENVVTTGSFLLMTETLKGSIGAGCCEIGPPSTN
jgi:membrane fusion protein, heavy metal efflux system